MFKLGQDVQVSFIGKITEQYIKDDDGIIYYAVTGGYGIARGLTEDQIHPLPEPQEPTTTTHHQV